MAKPSSPTRRKKREEQREVEKIQKLDATHVDAEDLQEMNGAYQYVNNRLKSLGELETTKHRLLHEYGNAEDNITLLKDRIIQKYGQANINLETGEISRPETKDDAKHDS